MIRTCRLFLPVRNNYNVSLFSQRNCQPKQTSVEFSSLKEQWKENFIQKKLCETVKSEYSTFKEHEEIEPENRNQKKKKKGATSDFFDFKENTTPKLVPPFTRNPLNLDKPEINLDFQALKQESVSNWPLEQASEFPNSASNTSANPEATAAPNCVRAPSTEKKSFSAFSFPARLASNKDVIKKLKLLVKSGKRDLAAIDHFSRTILSNRNLYNLSDCSDIFFSFARLSYLDMPTLKALSETILRELSEKRDHSPKELVSLVQSLGKMRFRNCVLIEALCDNIQGMDHSITVEQLTLCLFALSSLNVTTKHVDYFINSLAKVEITDFHTTKSFLNYIWASVILNKHHLVSKKHLQTVLSQSFLEQLCILGENTVLSKIKLSNINGVASKWKDYSGPTLSKLIFSPVLSRSKHQFLSVIRDSLSYLFPKTGFIQLLSYLDSGVFLDIECCMDSKMKPVPLKQASVHDKVGIVLMGNNDYCLGGSELTGINAFKLAQIKNSGYKVIIINEKDFPVNDSLCAKIEYLRQKLKEVLA